MDTAADNFHDTPVKPSSQFIQSIQAGLRYWQQRAQTLEPEQVQWLDERRKNLHQALLFGLNQPETWADTAQLLLQTFDFSEWLSYWPEWISMLEQALAIAPEKETVLYGRLQNRLGQLYRLDNRLPEAEHQHTAALVLAQKMANDELRVITYNCLAEYHLSQRNVAQTREYGQATLELAKTIPSLKRMEGFAHLSLGEIEEYVGNWSTAIEHNQQASEIWRKLNRRTYLARAVFNLGNAYREMGEFALAQQAYEEAETIFKPTNHVKDKVRVLLNLVVLYYRQEKWADAEATLLRVDPIALREQNDDFLLATFYNNFGNVYLKMGRWAQASKYLALAIEIFRQRDKQLEVGNCLGTLASVYEREGNQEKAIQLYEEALNLLHKFPESQWGQKLVREFGAAYEALLAKNVKDSLPA